MVEYVLKVEIGVQPDETWVNPTVWYPLGSRLHEYRRAAGTYVEIEGVGELNFDAEARQKVADATPVVEGQDALTDADASWRQTLPISGRPIVLLAVGGGNQVFDHWEGRVCRDQGARCEIAEPEGRADGAVIEPAMADFFSDVYAKAVFVRAPETDDARLTSIDNAKASHRVRRPPTPG